MKTNLRSLTLGSVALLLALLPGLPADADTILAQAPPAQGKAAPAPSPAPPPEKRDVSALFPPPAVSRQSTGQGAGRLSYTATAGNSAVAGPQGIGCRQHLPRRLHAGGGQRRGAPSRSSSMAARARPPPSCIWAPWGRVPSTSRPTAPPRSARRSSPTTPTPGSASPTSCSSIPSRPATAAAPPARRRPTAPSSASRRTRTPWPTSCGSTSRAQAACWHRCSWWARATAASAPGWSPTSCSPVALACKGLVLVSPALEFSMLRHNPYALLPAGAGAALASQRPTSSCATVRRARSISCPRSSASRARSYLVHMAAGLKNDAEVERRARALYGSRSRRHPRPLRPRHRAHLRARAPEARRSRAQPLRRGRQRRRAPAQRAPLRSDPRRRHVRARPRLRAVRARRARLSHRSHLRAAEPRRQRPLGLRHLADAAGLRRHARRAAEGAHAQSRRSAC